MKIRKIGTEVNDRIDIRISKEQKELVKYASSLSGFKNLSEFVLHCINKESRQIILENNEILKSLEDKRIFVETVLNLSEPNVKLRKAQEKYQQFLDGSKKEENTDTTP